MLLLTDIQLVYACPENNVDVWLAFLFLLREKFHAKQIFVLSSAMKLGPVLGPISQRSKIDRNCKSIIVAKKSVMSQYKSLL